MPGNRRQRKDSKILTYNGKSQTIKEWAAELGVTTKTILLRIQEKRPPDQIFSPDRRVSSEYGKDKERYFRQLEREADIRRELREEGKL